MLVTIAIPCYRSALSIESVVDGIDRVFSQRRDYDYQVVLVNDGSPDNTFEVIHRICQSNPKVTGINLSKNFGQSAAKMAAIPYVNGDVLVYMDDDGQHPPEGIFTLVDKVLEGYDIVYAHFSKKTHSRFKQITSNMHNRLLTWLGSKPKDIHLSSFLAMSKFSIAAMKESQCPVVAVAAYVRKLTHKVANVEMEQLERKAGSSGYTLKRLFTLWKKAITSFNTKLLELATTAGVFCSSLGVLAAIVLIIRKLITPNMQAGYASTLSLMLILFGITMFLVGIVGEYIGKIYLILCKLPPYKVREIVDSKSLEGEHIVHHAAPQAETTDLEEAHHETAAV